MIVCKTTWIKKKKMNAICLLKLFNVFKKKMNAICLLKLFNVLKKR